MPQWTPALEGCLQETEAIVQSLQIGNWFPVDWRSSLGQVGLWEIIDHGEAIGIFRPGMDVLNLGSGSGISSMLWAVRGYHVVGIEIEPKLVACARAQVQKYRHLFSRHLPVFIQGSYFPASYLEQRSKNSADLSTGKPPKICPCCWR
ncbi:methyltransferase domain-containing protein [Candidatus Woesearchaeota archaeon]|nr:methyltransferase domain-containing protein [Candidatus Woesearchaeota archaeon]